LRALKRHPQAIEVLTQAIERFPQNTNLLLARSTHYIALNLPKFALQDLDTCLQINPNLLQTYFDKADLCKQLQLYEEALACYNQVVLRNQHNLQALNNRAILYCQMAKDDQAIAEFSLITKRYPNYLNAFINLAEMYKKQKNYLLALDTYEQALKHHPNHSDIYFHLSYLHLLLNQFKLAEDTIRHFIQLQPNSADAYNLLGNILRYSGDWQQAMGYYQQALTFQPEHANALANCGVCLQNQGQLAEALTHFDAALTLDTHIRDAWVGKGMVVLQYQLDVDGSIACFEHAYKVDTHSQASLWNKACSLLLKGDFDHGWPLYEHRWSFSNSLRCPNSPLWLGRESLQNKHILLYGEQGLGDNIQFVRYASLVARLGAQVTLLAHPSLYSLLKNVEGVTHCYAFKNQWDDLPTTKKYDFATPLMSLPLALHTNLNSIPASTAYLTCESIIHHQWQQRLGVKKNYRIGLVWSGSNTFKFDKIRSLSLEQLLSFLPPQADYFALQKEFTSQDLSILERTNIPHFSHLLTDFSQTAGLCQQMDLIISVDTSVAHLAGALGLNTWILLPYSPDWRWLLDRTDSPWYPSVRLWRQPNYQDWQGVGQQLHVELKTICSSM
ncbi:MAG: tetratricopeptide repeat protein, partial [Gammaproteobacteria bacterium]|nr:tetratricopeptide repeat protein [Gammaproteobacteria bacterium]